MSIYKDCDIRGVYEKELFARDGYKVGRALATMAAGAAFCVGGDVRLSTPAIKEELIDGLLAGGAKVLDLGLVATPEMYFALKYLNAQAGAMVTASHNPPQYNGIKFMISQIPVTRAQMDRLKEIVDREAFVSGRGRLERAEVSDAYLHSLAARFGEEKKPLKVVVDAGNGAMSDIAPRAFERCGYAVERLFCRADGRFPNRTPNPAEYEKLTALGDRIRATGADFGVAFDGDGDRAVFADALGRVAVSERALVLFIRYLLKDAPTPVVYDQKSSSAVRRAILEMGGTPLPERSGHTFIKRRFLETGAAVAGEVSGHFFFGELGYDDGLYAALLMGEALLHWGKSLSEALQDVICPPITPDLRVFCPYAEQDGLLDAVEKAFAGCPVARMDGVRVETPDGWLLARKSVTAEQVTLRAEGVDQRALDALLIRARAAHPRLERLGES